MPTIQKFASSNGVTSGTAFTNPTNAYAGPDGLLATLTSNAKNTTVGEHDWGFPGITTAEIPDGSTIDAVRVIGFLGLTVEVTGGVMGLNGVANNAIDGGTEQTKSTAGLGLLTYTYATMPTLANLRTANFYECSIRYRRGNTTVSSTAQVDYVMLEVDYTPPAQTQHYDLFATDSVPIGADTVEAQVQAPGGGGGVTTYAADTFTRTVVDGWGTADTGGAWTREAGTAGNFNANGTRGTISTPAGFSAHVMALRSVSALDVSYVLDFQIDKLPAGASWYFDTRARASGTSTGEHDGYRASVETTSAGTFALRLSRVVGGAATNISDPITAGLPTPAANTAYRLRLELVGTNPTTVRARLWAASASEPSTWATEVTDSTGPQVAGFLTMRSQAGAITNAPLLVGIDDLDATGSLDTGLQVATDNIPIGADSVGVTVVRAATLVDNVPIGSDTVSAVVGETKPPFLSRPLASGVIHHTGGSNIVIENLTFRDLTGLEAVIRLDGVSGAIVRNCDFYNTSTPVRAVGGSNVVVEDCRYMNIIERATNPFNQFVQLNQVNGGAIRRNVGKGGQTEDIINMYMAHGTEADPIIIEDNHFEGVDWTSNSGSGIALGDGGGSWVIARNNILINPGQVGAFIAGGQNNRLENNIIIGEQRLLSNVGIYLWDLYESGTCELHTITGNRVHWTKEDGTTNHFWNHGSCEPSTVSGNVWGDTSLNIEDYRVDLEVPAGTPLSATDSIPVGVDAVGVTVVRGLVATDSVPVGSDSAATIAARSAGVSDSVPIGMDAPSAAPVLNVAASDSIPIGADTLGSAKALGVGASDSVPVGADAVGQAATRARTVQDGTITTDAIAAGRAYARAAADSAPIGADAIATAGGVGRIATDSVPIGADAVSRIGVFGIGVSDSVPIGADTIARTVQLSIGVVDITLVSDSIAAMSPQRAVPSSQVSNAGWAAEDGRLLNLHTSLTDQDDATFVRSETPSAANALVLGFGNLMDPGVDTGHYIRYRYSGNGADDLAVDLLQGNTVIATWTHTKPGASVQEAVQLLTNPQAASISDYSALRIRMRGTT